MKMSDVYYQLRRLDDLNQGFVFSMTTETINHADE
jgi:hypothetical protein